MSRLGAIPNWLLPKQIRAVEEDSIVFFAKCAVDAIVSVKCFMYRIVSVYTLYP
jgi:hypothetical protein